MAKKTEGYVDTSAFIAFLDRSDSYQALLRRLFSAPLPLHTSSLVIAEGHGWFLRRYDQHRAVQFLAFIDAELAKAGRIVRKFADRNLTSAGAHVLSIVRELRIASCWSTDRRLSLDGVPLVI